MLRALADVSREPRFRDLRFAWQRLNTSSRVAWWSIAAFAVGIAGYTTLFGVVDSMASRASAAVSRPDEVVRIFFREGGSLRPLSMALFDDFRAAAEVFEDVSAFGNGIAQITVTPRRKRRVSVMAVSGGYFGILQASPMKGRYFSLEDDKQVNGSDVAVVSADLWATLFERNPNTVGSRIVIGGTMYVVVGIAPPGFPGPGLGSADVWIPVKRAYEYDAASAGRAPSLWLLGRLRRGVTIAEGEVSATRAFQSASARVPVGWPPVAQSASDAVLRAVHSDSETGVGPWTTAFALSLTMVAAAAVGCLLLLRFAQPRNEAALRAALGAGRRPLALVLAWDVGILLAGAALAAGVAVVLGRVLFEDYSLVNPLGAGVSVRALAILSTVATLAGAFLAIIPALRAADEHPEGPWFTRLFPHEPEDVPIVDWTARMSPDDRDPRQKGVLAGDLVRQTV